MISQGVASVVGLALGSGVAMMGQGTAAFVKGFVESITTTVSAPGVASSSGGPHHGLPGLWGRSPTARARPLSLTHIF